MAKLITISLLMRYKIPLSTWRHAILYAATLVRIIPTSYNAYFFQQLAFGDMTNISHLRTFGCAVFVPIVPPLTYVNWAEN